MRKHKAVRNLFLVLLLAISIIACSSKTDNSNYILSSGKSVTGPLFIVANNATLEEGSSVNGSVVMLCCNLKVQGNVTGSVLLISGNLMVDTRARIDGDIKVLSGNISN